MTRVSRTGVFLQVSPDPRSHLSPVKPHGLMAPQGQPVGAQLPCWSPGGGQAEAHVDKGEGPALGFRGPQG